jgi:hypothetical protein
MVFWAGYGLLFRSEIFFRTTRGKILIFLSCKTQFFFPEYNIRLSEKNILILVEEEKKI